MQFSSLFMPGSDGNVIRVQYRPERLGRKLSVILAHRSGWEFGKLTLLDVDSTSCDLTAMYENRGIYSDGKAIVLQAPPTEPPQAKEPGTKATARTPVLPGAVYRPTTQTVWSGCPAPVDLRIKSMLDGNPGGCLLIEVDFYKLRELQLVNANANVLVLPWTDRGSITPIVIGPAGLQVEGWTTDSMSWSEIVRVQPLPPAAAEASEPSVRAAPWISSMSETGDFVML